MPTGYGAALRPTPVPTPLSVGQLTAEPRASPARRVPGAARPPAAGLERRDAGAVVGQGDVAGREQPAGPLGGGAAGGCCSRERAAGRRPAGGRGPAATSSRRSACGGVEHHLVQGPLGVVRAGRRERPLGRVHPPLHGRHRPGAGPGRVRPSWPPPPRPVRARRRLKAAGPAQRRQRRRAPAGRGTSLRAPAARSSSRASSRSAACSGSSPRTAVRVDDMVGDVGSDDRPLRLLDRCRPMIIELRLAVSRTEGSESIGHTVRTRARLDEPDDRLLPWRQWWTWLG